MVTKPKPKRVRWGVLGVAKIATEKVIPAMQQCKYARIAAIASRNLATAQRAAKALRIPRAHGSYEALINDSHIDAVYIPLPTTSTSSGPSRRRAPESTCCARSRSRSRRAMSSG